MSSPSGTPSAASPGTNEFVPRLVLRVGAPVLSVTVSPDGTRIVGGGDGMVRVWDLTTGAPVGEPLIGHDSGVWSVAVSPDGTRIVSGGCDGSVRVWDRGTEAPVGEPLTGHDGGVVSVAVSPDGTRILSGGFDGSVRVWDLGTGGGTDRTPFGAGVATIGGGRAARFPVGVGSGQHGAGGGEDQRRRVGLGRGARLVPSPFPQAARRTGRASFPAPGSPVVLLRG